MDDGLVLRADVFRPVKDGRYPVHPDLRPLRQGPRVPGRLSERVGAHGAEASRRHRRLDATSTRTGRWSIPRSGCRTTMSACASIPAAPAARPATSITSRRARPRTSTTASNGRACSRGRTARSASTASPTTASTSGTSRRCSRRISPRCASGRAAADWYRDMTHHGGILCTFWENWYDMQVKTVQYGAGERGKRSRVHGELVCGPETLSEEELARQPRARSATTSARIRSTTTTTSARSPVWSKVKTPFLSAANWGGQPLHPRGNFEGFVRAAAKDKWLEVHGIEHWTHFYTDYGRELQLRFFDHFLHGKDNGWDKQPRVQLQVRHRRQVRRARTRTNGRSRARKWTQVLSRSGRPGAARASSRRARPTISFDAMGDGVTFLTAPLADGNRDHRAVGAEAVRVVVDQRTPNLRGAARVLAGHEGGRVPGRDRSAHAGRRRAGCAPRTASSTRSCRSRSGPITPTTRSSR